MTAERASRTAEYMALFRALESTRPASQRLFEDRFAVAFLPGGLRAIARLARVPPVGAAVAWWIDSRWPGARTAGVARTRLIDDLLAKELGAGATQVVILGAGFDSRAYRMPELAAARVFEVDHPATSARKRAAVQEMLGTLPPHVAYVAIDFNRDPLDVALDAAGISGSARTLVIWEGVTNYLSASAVDATLRSLARLLPAGSRLVFTYVHRGVLDGSFGADERGRLFATLARAGEPWTFGLDPAELPAYLEARGLALVWDVGADEYRGRYLARRGGQRHGYEFYRVALAERRAG